MQLTAPRAPADAERWGRSRITTSESPILWLGSVGMGEYEETLIQYSPDS